MVALTTPDRRLRRNVIFTKTVGPYTTSVVEKFLTSGSEPEQGYKFCASLTRLGDRYGIERPEKACERVLSYTTQPSIRNISTLLKNGQDRVHPAGQMPETVQPRSHGITRGAAYFQRGGEQS